jgi:hypothetical protein
LDALCDANGQVTALLLAKKYIRGQIPHDLGLLTDLTSLSLLVNQLSATILSSLGALTALKILWLKDNQLVGTTPFCNSDQSFGCLVADRMEVNCTCCTHSCPLVHVGPSVGIVPPNVCSWSCSISLVRPVWFLASNCSFPESATFSNMGSMPPHVVPTAAAVVERVVVVDTTTAACTPNDPVRMMDTT